MAKLHITVADELKEKIISKVEDAIYRVGCEDKDTGSYEYKSFKDIKSAEDYARNSQWFWATMVIEENGITRLLKEYKLGVLVKEYENFY